MAIDGEGDLRIRTAGGAKSSGKPPSIYQESGAVGGGYVFAAGIVTLRWVLRPPAASSSIRF